MSGSRWTGLFAALLGMSVASGGLGCKLTCEKAFDCEPENEELSCPEDPAELAQEVPEACGLWVSSSQGDDGHIGSQQAPLATLGEAAARALQGVGPRRVYACAETFEQPLQWPAGVALHGGYACASLDWRYSRGAPRTRIAPPADTDALLGDAVALTLTGSTLPAPALLTDLWIEAADAPPPGGSSIAVLALAGTVQVWASGRGARTAARYPGSRGLRSGGYAVPFRGYAAVA